MRSARTGAVSMSIEPQTADDKKKLGEALTTIRREDPSFRSNYNDETGETIARDAAACGFAYRTSTIPAAEIVTRRVTLTIILPQMPLWEILAPMRMDS